MAQIVLVHGIAQGGRSPQAMESEWLTGLATGLREAEHGDLAEGLWRPDSSISAAMAFYAKRAPDQQGDPPEALDENQLAAADEIAEEWLDNATLSSRPSVAREAELALYQLHRDQTDQQGLRTAAVRAAAALDRIPYFTMLGISVLGRVNPALTEVTRYLTDETVRDYALARCAELINSDTRVVIGHSLGSIVAFEAICENPHPVPLLVTLGSPLGLNGVNRRLRQRPGWPTGLGRWVNLADKDDIVAARPDLHSVFDRNRPADSRFDATCKIDNGYQPHRVGYYLTQRECGKPVAEALSAV